MFLVMGNIFDVNWFLSIQLHSIHLVPLSIGIENAKVNDDEFYGFAWLNANLDTKFISVHYFGWIVAAIAYNLEVIQTTTSDQILEEWSNCLHILLTCCLGVWFIEELS